jgi:hypothetical protein
MHARLVRAYRGIRVLAVTQVVACIWLQVAYVPADQGLLIIVYCPFLARAGIAESV